MISKSQKIVLLPFPSVDTSPVFNQLSFLPCASFLLVHDRLANALWFKSNGSYDIKVVREKKEELESKSSHKSDIWSPAAYKKGAEMFGEYFFFRL